MKKSKQKKLKEKLDKLTKEVIFKRDGHKCVQCGSTKALGWGHVFSRRSLSTRWDLDNAHVQCWPCNFKHVRDQYPYFEWFKKEYGEEEFHDLRRRFKTIKKWNIGSLEELIKTYENILEG